VEHYGRDGDMVNKKGSYFWWILIVLVILAVVSFFMLGGINMFSSGGWASDCLDDDCCGDAGMVFNDDISACSYAPTGPINSPGDQDGS